MFATAFNQNPEVVKVLLDAGVDIEARDMDGETPLMHAAGWNQNPEIVKILLEAGVNGRAEDNEGLTAFDYAEINEYIRDTEVYWLLDEAQY